MRLAAALVLPLLLLGSRAAHAAGIGVSISHASDEHHELARRIASELSSEGYDVEVHAGADPSPCEPNGARLAAIAPVAKAWIRLAASGPERDTVVASICYLGALPFLQQAAPSGPLGDPRQLALATAEALNGLRSKLPPAGAAAPSEPAQPRVETDATRRLKNDVVLGAAFVLSLPDFPIAPGVQGRATLGLGSSVGLSVDTFAPTAGRDLSNELVTAAVQTAWLRIGPRFDWPLGDFTFSVTALAGPAITWAKGVARPPRIGTTDVTTGAVLSLGTSIEYPRRGPIFACGSASASALLPGVRVRLGEDDSVPRGYWPVEGSIGLGVRWGGDPSHEP